MPVYMIYACAHCGTEAPRQEYGAMAPPDWVNVIVHGRTEWFDKWECLQTYAGEQQEERRGE